MSAARKPPFPRPYDGHAGTLDLPPKTPPAAVPPAPRVPAPDYPIDAPTVRLGAEVSCRRCGRPVHIDGTDFVWVHVNVYDAYRPDIHTAEV